MSKSLRVLIVEDSEDDALMLLRELFRGEYEPTYKRVDNPRDMAAALAMEQWELVLSDYSMPDFDGLAALQVLKDSGKDLPFIIVSGILSEDAAVAALKAGAHDFIRKENLARLLPAVERELREAVIRSENKQLENQLLRIQRFEAIGTLANGIAHDLNNVLGPVMMAADILSQDVQSEESLKVLEMLRTSAEHGSELIRQMLTFTRGLKGERMLVQPAHLIKEEEKLARETFSRNIQIKSMIPADIWPLNVNPVQFHQALLNLCLNARDAMPQGGTMTLNARNVEITPSLLKPPLEVKPGRYVEITVADTGVGIPEVLMDKIFDPFFTTKNQGSGTGLGLSTTLAIIRDHGGFLDAKSVAGEGSLFTILIPAAEPSGRAGPGADPARLRGSGELILVVDDEPAVRSVIKMTLEANGYQALTACDGAEAMSLYAQKRHEIKAVLLDLDMPVMDGPTTLKVLLRINSEVKVLVMSGLSESAREVREVRESCHVSALIRKPIETTELLAGIKNLVKP